jgi:cell division GTPase FtsZ
MTNNELQQQAYLFARSNLVECCKELLELADTAVLQNGKVRELRQMCSYAGSSAMGVAESLIKRAAFEAVVEKHDEQRAS